MKQILNIFRKDLRRYWRESAVSVALLVTYAWNEVKGWRGEGNVAAYGGIGGLISYQFLSGLVVVLLPVAWSFLIVRVIQGEALVGDRQFWVTRPYEWKKLLAAKVLFVVVTINLPLLIVDFILLAKAGFPPTHYVIGLLWMQLLISLIPILPIATLATVTASVVQMILAVLGIVLYMIGVAALASVIPSSSFSEPADSLQLALFIATCVAVILWQYARWKTAGSRWLIAGLAVAVVLILVATPYNAIVNREFPRLGPSEPLPVQLALLPPLKQDDGNIPDSEKEVEIEIPVSVSGLADDSIVTVNGTMVAIEAPDGLHWNSGWRSHGWSLFREDKGTSFHFTLKKKLFERIKSLAVKGNISLALTVYRDQNRREFIVPRGAFVIPGVGFCTTGGLSYQPQIECRAPLRTPSSVLATYDISQTACPVREGDSRAKPGEISRDWERNSDSGPAEFGISPVKTIRFLTVFNASNARAVAGLCPGTPIVLSNPEPIGRTRIDVDLTGLRLVDYRIPQVRFGTTGYGFAVP